MAEKRGPFLKARSTMATQVRSRVLIRRFGYEGFGLYVALLLRMLDEDEGTFDISDGDVYDALADDLGVDGHLLRELVSFLGARGFISADALGDGVIRAAEVDEALASYDRYRRAGRAGGSASGKSRARSDA